MSTENDVARSLRSWLKESRHEDANRVLDAVFDQVPATPHRRAPWWPAWRFPPMNSNIVRFGIAAAAIVLVVILGLNFLSGPNVGGDPEATPTPSAPASAIALPFANTELDGGTYSLGQFPVGITFEVPTGWFSCSEGPVEQGVCHAYAEDGLAVALNILIVDNVVADPCTTSNELLDPPVGPSVEALVTAISNLEGFDATPALDLTVDGFNGKQFTLTPPRDAVCELKVWATKSRTNGVGADEVNLLRILDVDGVRVMISGAYHLGVPEAELSALQQVIASVHIEP
jgi:hypothetical protein